MRPTGRGPAQQRPTAPQGRCRRGRDGGVAANFGRTGNRAPRRNRRRSPTRRGAPGQSSRTRTRSGRHASGRRARRPRPGPAGPRPARPGPPGQDRRRRRARRTRRTRRRQPTVRRGQPGDVEPHRDEEGASTPAQMRWSRQRRPTRAMRGSSQRLAAAAAPRRSPARSPASPAAPRRPSADGRGPARAPPRRPARDPAEDREGGHGPAGKRGARERRHHPRRAVARGRGPPGAVGRARRRRESSHGRRSPPARSASAVTASVANDRSRPERSASSPIASSRTRA